MKKFYSSVVIACLIFTAIIPIPANVQATANAMKKNAVNHSSEETSDVSASQPTSKETTETDRIKVERSDSYSGSTKAKEVAVEADDTYLDIFPDEAFAEVIALEITGSNDTSQTVTQAQLDSLTSLNAPSKNITDVTGIQQLTKLKSINLSKNNLTSIAPITNLTALTTLDVSANLLEEISITSAQNIPNLTALSVLNNPTIKKLSIEDQAKLTSISISVDNDQAAQLAELTLSNLPALTNAPYAGSVNFSNYSDYLSKVKLTGLPQISSVTLNDTQINDVTIEDLAKLTKLNLSDNKLTDMAQMKLQDLPLLNDLDVADNQWNSFILDAENATEFPNLASLHLNGNPTMTNISLEDQPKLKTVSISVNTGQTAQLAELTLSNLPALTSAPYAGFVNFSNYSDYLSKVKLTGLPQISSVTLNDTQINDVTIEDLDKLTKLNLSDNKLTDMAQMKLQNLPLLNDLDVIDNQWNSFILDAENAAEFPNLASLHLNDNPTMTKISLEDQPKLKLLSIDVSGGQTTQLEELTLSNLPALTNAPYAGSVNFSNYSDYLSKVKLTGLPQISSVTLNDTQINDVTIEDLDKLTKLNLSDNKLTDMAQMKLQNLPLLNDLDVIDNQWTSFILDAENAAEFPNLASLHLNDNPTMTKISLEDQPKLKLLSIDVSGGQTTQLEELTLSNLPALTNAPYAGSVNFSNYSDYLSKVKLTGLPQISNVNLSNNQLTNVLVENMDNLKTLTLYNNKLTELDQLSDLPVLNSLDVSNNSIGVLPTSLETEAPVLQSLTGTNQTISLPNKIVSDRLSVENKISNDGVISPPTAISNSGVYENGNVIWEYNNIKDLSSVSYNFSEPVNYPAVSGTFSGKVTQPFKISLPPVITADESITYPKFSTITEAAFLIDVHATTNDGSPVTSDFLTAVDFNTAGNYTVTLNSVNEDGVTADPVTVIVHVEKAPAPIITADSEISYMKNSTVSSSEFLNDIHATTNDGSPVTSDFTTVVDFSTAGNYTVTLNSVNEDGITADPVTVIVHVEKAPAPIITADSEISYMKNSTVSSSEFLSDIHATTNDGSPVTSDFFTVVDLSTPGDYTVTLQAINEDGVPAVPVSVTVHVEQTPAPIITADTSITYPLFSEVTEAEFLSAIHAKTSDGSPITSDFTTVVDFSTAGDYTVTLNSINADGITADPVTVIVHVKKATAKPIITADKEITYPINSVISQEKFYADIHATTNDGSPITSDFLTVVDFNTPGDYTVTLQAINKDGLAANPVKVIVHITPSKPTPPVPPDNNGNSSNSSNSNNGNGSGNSNINNSDNTDNKKSAQQTNIILPRTGDTNNHLIFIGFNLLLLAFCVLSSTRKLKKIRRQ
ncbi:LapB repeat-containing protein [Listeria seeligeri]|uniref:LapB repeat-containing protein n=4 Tax=Listeria seeligeri TaxID=1640 RepID=UPI00162359C5|nr:LapB repeat-containing protein [Listeria seeligeri]MBC1539476.1 LapB repeat-containing protein [Listeria seeligeri]